ncbi:MAG: hypothetical protein MJ003_05660 [Paludibacteraceae bacterium]|nr:hypothetical protein [Paludibacteraceae bacterium]
MNDENRYFKIFCFLMFVAFAAVSCWSTTESLSLTLEGYDNDIPKWVFWVAVIGLYVLTAYCTKLFIDSFNSNIYVEHRSVQCVISLLGIIVLWVLFSMPTNAHTYFYKQMAKDTSIKELKHLDGELSRASNEHDYLAAYNDKWNSCERQVLQKLEKVKQEIQNSQQPGFGPYAEKYLSEAENELKLETGSIPRRKTRNTTQKELNEVCAYYDHEIKAQLEILKNQHQTGAESELANFKNTRKGVQHLKNEINQTLKELNDGNIEKEPTLKKSRDLALRCYSELNNLYGGIFNKEKDAKDAGIYESDRLVKVTNVWIDYFQGEFKTTNYTFWYWILLSVIVDVAAFAFFDIAFKRED